MIGRIVRVLTDWQTVSAIQDFHEIKMGAAQAGFFLRARQMQSSDEASTEAELLKLAFKRATGSFTSGSGGGSSTVVKGQTGDAAHGLATTERNNTTQAVAGSGTLETFDAGAFNVLAGEHEQQYIPEEMIPLGPGEALIISLEETPADALTVNVVAVLLITHG